MRNPAVPVWDGGIRCPLAPLPAGVYGAAAEAPPGSGLAGSGRALARAVRDRAGQAVASASWPVSVICSMAGACAVADLRSRRTLAKPKIPARPETVPRPNMTREMM